MTTTDLYTHLWIRIYNDFDIIPDLRKTGIAKIWQLLVKKLLHFFSLCPVDLFAKKKYSYIFWFFDNRSSNLQRNLKEI